MEKEFNLSKKMHCRWCCNGCDEPHSCTSNSGIYVNDVKEFIRQQHEKLLSRLFGEFALSPNQLEFVMSELRKTNKELAGEDLI